MTDFDFYLERVKTVRVVSDPPTITPEIALVLSDEGARNAAAYFERTRHMEHAIDCACRPCRPRHRIQQP